MSDKTDVLEAPSTARQSSSAPGPPHVASTGRGVLAFLGRSVPTICTLSVLAALAVWGHRTGWTLPKFSALMGGAPAGKEDWCGEHGVPESECVECNADLLPRVECGWCKTHGVHNCPFEHPEVTQLPDAPRISADDLARARRALDFAERPENNSKCKLHLRRIQFASAAAAERAGVEVEPVWRAAMIEDLPAPGEITYDQTRIARMSARVPGSVWRVEKQVGDFVRRGEVLALVEAAEVGRAKEEFLQAVAQLRLKTKTYATLRDLAGTVAGQKIHEAETAVSEAQFRLLGARQALVNLGLPVDVEDLSALTDRQLAAHVQFLGLPDPLRQSLDPKTTTANLLPLKAPLDGTIVFRDVVAGEVVDTSKTLFVVADTHRMWLTLNVRQEDTGKLTLGQRVRFRPDGGRQETSGTVAWIDTAVDERTRTLKVRADVANPDGRLHANVFGKGRIILREEDAAIVVPNGAVHWEGDCYVVFVRDKHFLDENAPKVFHTRTVRPGARDEKNTEIIAGVLPGELVATKGSGTLRSELLKGNLGEG